MVEGGVSGYYRAFRSTISRILDDDPGCDGWWISPQVENPQHQILMINWKSVDVRHPSTFLWILKHNLMLVLGSSRGVRETTIFPAVYRCSERLLRRVRGAYAYGGSKVGIWRFTVVNRKLL